MRGRLTLGATLGVAVMAVLSCGPAEDAGRTAASAEGSAAGVRGDSAAYDSALARALGADEYGMKSYVMAILKAGPNHDMDSTTAALLLQQHLANIHRLAEAGKLVLAGPFSDTSALAGIYVFNVSSVEEARALTETDPAIQAGRFVMELHPWYGPARLQQMTELNSRVERKRF